jgi:outer membrane protein
MAIMARSAAVLVLLLLGSAAQAADDPAEAPSRGRIVTIGLGAQVAPKYPGADSIVIAPLPRFDLRHVGDPLHFGAPDQGTGIGLLGSRSRIDFGPVVQLQGKRKEKDVGAPVGNVGLTVEVGGFMEAWVTPNLRFRAEGRQGIGGHKALVGDLSADFVARDDDHTIFSIGPRLRLSDAKYQRAYFGVTPAVAVRTGLPAYRPGDGPYAAGAVAGILHQFNSRWGIWAYAGYDRLIRNAGKSPIVRAFGSRDQYSGGVALTYSFVVGRR